MYWYWVHLFSSCYPLSFLTVSGGRDKIASKLEQRTGYTWKIETANWTPDGKVHVYDAVADLDGGIMRVAQVDITPNVDEVVDGRLVFEELSIRQPELDVSVQWAQRAGGEESQRYIFCETAGEC